MPLLDKVLPHSTDAEKAVLGAMLISPIQAGSVIRGRLTGDEFYHAAHQTIYGECAKMLDAGQPLDLVTLTQRLSDMRLLEEMGGPAYLADLTAAVATTANVEYYIGIVEEKALRRKLIGVGHDLAFSAFDEGQEIEQLHAEACTHILGAVQGRVQIQDADSAIRDGLEQYEKALASDRKLLGLSTGFNDLDYLTRGLEPESTCYIAARPSVGKTSLLLAIVAHIAEHEQVPVGILSLEQSARALCMRMVAARCGLNLRHPKELSQDDHSAVVKSAMEIKKLPIYIDDRAGLRLSQVRSTCRMMKSKHGCGLFALDHLQLTAGESKQRVYDHLREFTAAIHDMAKELKVPFIVLSQLNRELEKEGRLPRLSDLRECGSVEQDADIVALLSPVEKEQREYLPAALKELPESELGLLTRVNLAKQREGQCGPYTNIYLSFEKHCTRYRNVRFQTRQERLGIDRKLTAEDYQPG